MLSIDWEPPRLQYFCDRKLRLLPGMNEEIDEGVFQFVWKHDRFIKDYYKKGAFKLFKDGKEWVPDGHEDRATRPDAELLGQVNRIASSEVREAPPEALEEQKAVPPSDPIAPTPVGTGGVPGKVQEAMDTVKQCKDAQLLEKWLGLDRRKMVKDAIQKRLTALEGDF